MTKDETEPVEAKNLMQTSEIAIVKTFCVYGHNVFKKQPFWPLLSAFWP